MKTILLALCFAALPLFAGRAPSHTRAPNTSHTRKAPPIPRSSAAKTSFKRGNPCPGTGKSTGACSGYVIDHVRPLACGGADDPSNMAWQTTAEAKRKDATERRGCR